MMVIPALSLIFAISMLSPLQIRRLSVVGYFLCVILLCLTFFYGIEIKGAKRWLSMAGNSIQPSEFMKPFFAVVSAWMFAEKAKNPDFPGFLLSFSLLGIVVSLLMLQPDLGMTVIIVATWMTQLFLSGIPMIWIGIVGGMGFLSLITAYTFFPHVTKRIDQFLDSSGGDVKNELYQITQSLEAFMNGGLFGKGPGEGIVKKNVPDAHADFVFAIAGEEFGFIICLIIVVLFGVIVVRSLMRLLDNAGLFVVLAACGLSTQLGFQTFVNMASSLHLIPTKGMTMPFISYGGSSLIALGIGAGMLLGLTRKSHGVVD